MSFQTNSYNVIILGLISSGCMKNVDRDRYVDHKASYEIIDPIEDNYQDTGTRRYKYSRWGNKQSKSRYTSWR